MLRTISGSRPIARGRGPAGRSQHPGAVRSRARRLPFFLGPVLLLPALLGAQTSPQLSAILERLDRLEQENHTLIEEVRALRARLEGVATPASSAAAPAAGAETSTVPVEPEAAAKPTIEERLNIQAQRIEDQSQTKVEASQRFPIRLTGMAVFNAFANSRTAAGSEYPVTASAPGPRSAGATFRQTVIGLDYRGPSTFWGGNVHGSVYMDFTGGTPNREIRLRTGSIQIDWKTRSVMAGLEKPIFNPREPSSLAQLAVSPLTGAGNLWLWLPQARFEQDFTFGPSNGLRAQVGVLQTREVGPYSGAAPFTGALEAARPALEGRFEVFHKLDDERRLEIAPGFHTSKTHVAGMSVPSNLFSLDWFGNPLRRLELTGAFYTGKNVAPLGEGYQQGYGIYYRRAAPVASRGGWAQLTLHTLPRLDLHLFSGQQDDDNRDLDSGRIGKNLLFGGNLYYRLAPNVILALEATQLRTAYIGQPARLNNHYDLALAYFF